jgi:FKBP-type peptidyl-prolyl cis-trans isomerase FkpA
MTKFFNTFVGVVVAGTMLFSCDSYKVQTDKFGSKFQIHESKSGKKIKEGDIVTFDLVIKDSGDTTYRNTYKEGKPFQMPAQKGVFRGSFEDALLNLSVGDSATIFVPADSLFTKNQQPLPPTVSKGSDLRFMVKIRKTESREEFQHAQNEKKNNEAKIMEDFVKKTYPNATKTQSGIYKVILKEGIGSVAQKGQTSTVHYTGKFMNGGTFDSSVGKDPFPVTIGTGSVIVGWEQVLETMKKGEKCWVFIPSVLAYGEQGSPPTIEPFTPLIFEMEVLDIK